MMTRQQREAVKRTKEKIEEIRNILDGIMYYSEQELDEEDFCKVREAYDIICSATDRLP